MRLDFNSNSKDVLVNLKADLNERAFINERAFVFDFGIVPQFQLPPQLISGFSTIEISIVKFELKLKKMKRGKKSKTGMPKKH